MTTKQKEMSYDWLELIDGVIEMKTFKIFEPNKPSKYVSLLELSVYVSNERIFDEISEMKVGSSVGLNDYTVVERVK